LLEIWFHWPDIVKVSFFISIRASVLELLLLTGFLDISYLMKHHIACSVKMEKYNTLHGKIKFLVRDKHCPL